MATEKLHGTEELNPAYADESLITRPDDLLSRRLLNALSEYDSYAEEAEHLRPHQVEAVGKFINAATAIASGKAENTGMSILNPTGSGKTVIAGEITRAISGHEIEENNLRVLMLVPGYQVLNQTTGIGDEIGAIRTFAPDITVGEYSGKNKETTADLTVMNYQALSSAVGRGDIDRINPALVICDEAHHVIDGKWAESVRGISRGRLLLGLTATPAYSSDKNVRRLFPNVLAHKTLREGIEEGILAPVQGFLYKGSSKLVVAKGGKDYTDAEIFSAIADSKDNYLAAAICAKEVAEGRRGVVSCAPGFDRAHAKIMAKILSHTPIRAQSGERLLRAEYVDGETHPDSLKDIFSKYKKGQIDVLTYVDLLLEGWDSPETEFGVMLRPTRSRVLAEQRIGRIVRPSADKIARLHEILYEVVGDSREQQTHLDVFSDDVLSSRSGGGSRHGSPRDHKPPKRGEPTVFDVDKFTVDPELITAMTAQTNAPADQTELKSQENAIPYSWNSAHVLATKFNISRQEVLEFLEEQVVDSKTLEVEGVSHTYYSPAAAKHIAQSLGVPKLPSGEDSPMTIHEIAEYLRENSYATVMRPQTVEKHLENAGIEPTMYITDDDKVVIAYPFESRNIPLQKTNQPIYEKPEQLDEEVIEAAPDLQVVNWLAQILVDPKSADTMQSRKRILLGQSCLLAAMRDKADIDPDVQENLSVEVAQWGVEPSDQMINVMRTKNVNFIELLTIGQRAKFKFDNVGNARPSRKAA